MYNSDIDTTQKMRQLEKELKKLYGDAYARLTAESEKYFDEFEERYEKQYEAYRQGKYTKQEFDAWYLNQVARGERWEALRDDMARKVTNANVEAAKLINATTPEVFRTNYNWSAYEAEKASGIAFNVYSESAVQQLMQDDPNLLPPKKINVAKDVAWNKKKLSNAVASGILTGKGIDQISKSFGQVTDMNWAAAVRNARTAVTSAQNAGRQQNMEDIEEFAEANGLKLQKEWVSANDGRVRDSHAELNGVRVDIDEKFPNGLMYPADPNGAPAEVYNCRCAQCTVIDGKMARRTDKTKETYEKWVKDKEASREEKLFGRKNTNDSVKFHTTAYNDINKMLDIELKDGAVIEYNEVKTLKTALSEEQIISKISGGDMTDGSCSSLTFAYIGNKKGLNVTDFRGGDSQSFFADKRNGRSMCDVAGAKTTTYMLQSEAKDAAKILSTIEDNKEYRLSTGMHAAIVRKRDGVLEYLELQAKKDNGWKPFETTRTYEFLGSTFEEKTTVKDTLIKRFGCKRKPDKLSTGKIHEKEMVLTEVDSFRPTSEFKEMLGYLNTATDAQMKGASGNVK